VQAWAVGLSLFGFMWVLVRACVSCWFEPVWVYVSASACMCEFIAVQAWAVGLSLFGFMWVLLRACVSRNSDVHDPLPVCQINGHHIPEDCSNLAVAIHLPTCKSSNLSTFRTPQWTNTQNQYKTSTKYNNWENVE